MEVLDADLERGLALPVPRRPEREDRRAANRPRVRRAVDLDVSVVLQVDVKLRGVGELVELHVALQVKK